MESVPLIIIAALKTTAAQIRINRACVDLVVTVTAEINGLQKNPDRYIMELEDGVCVPV